MPTATEVKDETRNTRERAAKGNAAVVDLEAQRKKTEALYSFANDKANEAAALVLERKGLNEQMKAIFDEVEAKGFDRKAFKDMLRLKALDSDQRVKYEATRRQLAKAFGFESGEQLDIFEPLNRIKAMAAEEGARITLTGPDGEEVVLAEGEAKKGDTLDEQDMDAERAAAIGDHLAKHGSTPKH